MEAAEYAQIPTSVNPPAISDKLYISATMVRGTRIAITINTARIRIAKSNLSGTGSEMIVWGGNSGVAALQDGGRYNPVSDSWQPTTLTNAPSARANNSAVWTGSEMIVWGGNDGSTLFNTGGRYGAFAAQIRQPINADGSSVFEAKRGVVPVKFTLTINGSSTCDLPPATISLTRTTGAAPGPIDESVYIASADTGSNFRISGCQYVYNLSSNALGPGTYEVDISISGVVVGKGIFALK